MILRRRGRGEPETVAPTRASPRTEMYEGTTITPDEGAALRVDSAADVDPNVKARGLAGIPRGDAGGYGGAGTK